MTTKIARKTLTTHHSALILSWLAVATPSICAASANFDFNSGVPIEFSIQNSGGLWNVDSDGPSLLVSKLADDGSSLPNSFIFGGVNSQFAMVGDFFVTVDFNLINFPAAGPNGSALNEAVLSVSGNQGGESLSILRYNTGSSSGLEIFSGAPVGDQPSNLNVGHLRISRSGDTLIGSVSTPGANNFVQIGSVGGFTSPQFTINLSVVQGANAGSRSTTAMEVDFDNLEVFADELVAVPEPSTLALGATALLALTLRRRR